MTTTLFGREQPAAAPAVRELVTASIAYSARLTHAAWSTWTTTGVLDLSAPLCRPAGMRMHTWQAGPPTCRGCRRALQDLDHQASAAMVTDADLRALHRSLAITTAATLVMATGELGGHPSMHDPRCSLSCNCQPDSFHCRRHGPRRLDPAAKAAARAAGCDRREGCHWPQPVEVSAEVEMPEPCCADPDRPCEWPRCVTPNSGEATTW